MSSAPNETARRLLILLPFPPRLDGLHGGSRVTAQLVHALAGRHDVAAVYLREPHDAPIDDRLRERLSRVEEILVPPVPPLGTRIARKLAPLRGIPAWVSYTNVPALAARVREMTSSWRPDIVQFEFHVMGQYAGAVRHLPARRVLTQHEVGTLAAREHLALASGTGPLRAALERRAWARYERRVVAAMDAVVVFTDRDRDMLRPLAGSVPIVRIGIGTQVPPAPLDPVGTASEPRLTFVGNFNHPPNIDAALRLVESIFPAVRSRVPDATLYIVGANPPDRVRAAARDGVHVTGTVPDVTPWLNEASLVVVPLRLGAGMRVKVLEALAHGKAVLASPRALEGIDVADGVHVATADTDEEFANRAVELLGNAKARRGLATRAREWACAHLGEANWVQQYDALYDTLLTPPGRRS